MSQFAKSSVFAVLCDSDGDDEHEQAGSSTGKKKRKPKKKAQSEASVGEPVAPAKAPQGPPPVVPAAAPVPAKAGVMQPVLPPPSTVTQAPAAPKAVTNGKAKADSAVAVEQQQKAAGAGDPKAKAKKKAKKSEEGSVAHVAGNAFAALLLEDASVGQEAQRALGVGPGAAPAPAKPAPAPPVIDKAARGKAQEPPLLLDEWKAAGGVSLTEEEALERESLRAERLAVQSTQQLLDELASRDLGHTRKGTIFLALARQGQRDRLSVQYVTKSWHVAMKLMCQEILTSGKYQTQAMEALGALLACGETRLNDRVRNSMKDYIQDPKLLKKMVELADTGEVSAVVALRDLQMRDWFSKKQVFHEMYWSDYSSDCESDGGPAETRTGRLVSALAGTSDLQRLKASLSGLATVLKGPRAGQERVRHACATRLKWLSDNVAPVAGVGTSAAQSSTLAAALGSKAAPAPPPQSLRVIVPDSVTAGKAIKAMDGVYVLTDKLEGGYRVWKQQSGSNTIWMHHQGWAVGPFGEGLTSSKLRSYDDYNRLPHQQDGWSIWESGKAEHEPKVKVTKAADTTGAAKVEQWAVYKDVKMMGLDTFRDHMTVEQARLKCLQLPWCEGFCYEEPTKPLMGEKSRQAPVVQAKFKKFWVPVSVKGWTSVHLQDPAAALSQNSKQLGECSPWRSLEVLRPLLQVAGSFGSGGPDLVQPILTPRPAAIASLAESIERLPADEMQVGIRILTLLSQAPTSARQSSMALPAAAHETMVKLASQSEGPKRAAMLAALATQPVADILKAGAAQAFIPQLSASAPVDEGLVKLLKHLLSSGGLDEALRAGLLGQLHHLAAGEQELPLASLLESMVEAGSEPWASVRPQWQGPAQDLLRAVLQPRARPELQVAAVHLVPRTPSPALCELLVRIAEAGQPQVRIEALVAVLQVPLDAEVGTRAAKVCASALKAPKENVRSRAAKALAETLHAGRLPAWIFGQVLLPELVAVCEHPGREAVSPTSTVGFAASCLLEAVNFFPDAAAAEHLGKGGAANAILAAAEAGALDPFSQAPAQVLRKAERLDSAEVVLPRLMEWLQGDKAELKLLVAKVAGQDVEDNDGLQRLLDSGLLAGLFAMPRKLKEESQGTHAKEDFTRLSRYVATVSITAVRKARRDQVQPIVDAGVCAWLCTALEVELSKLNQARQHYRPGRIYCTDDMCNQAADEETEMSVSEGIFVDIGDAILTVLQLGPEAVSAIVAAFTDVGNLRSELKAMLYRKDRPHVNKMSEQLLEKLISKQREQRLQQIFCKRCTETPQQCFRCKGAAYDTCFACKGNGKVEGSCKFCGGTGSWKDGKQCYRCKGKGDFSSKCNKCWGEGKWACGKCHGTGKPYCKACESLRRGMVSGTKLGPEPKPGVKITQCSPADLEMLRKLWKEREGPPGKTVKEAWNVDNPLLTWRQRKCVQEFKNSLGKDPDELRGFHGTAKGNVLSIVKNGFDAGKRAGQLFGAGEYFAKNPSVSIGYCRGDEYMLVCQLCLGQEASDPSLGNGDHIWVPSAKYYVIATPAQVVPLYIIRFDDRRSTTNLEEVLELPVWSTLEEAGTREIPPNRPAKMVAESTDLLWIGYLDPQVSDKQLLMDLQAFLDSHLPQDQKDRQVQVVRGRYTQAKVRLAIPVQREVVFGLCEKPFTENGKERTVTVDDAHGSPDMPCPRTIAHYCRGQNLRFVDPCWCLHKASPTIAASYTTEPLDLKGAKADEIRSNFMQSSPFHTGMPRVVAINAIQNDTLGVLHDKYKAYLRDKNKEEPKIIELYHGTNNKILDTLYTHGLQPPSDTVAADDCPVSGGKRLHTTLCNNDCVKCVERHQWNRCHMFGLGIYLADLAQKSHRYISEPVSESGCTRYRMVLCSVAMGKVLELNGHLREAKCMHDVQSLRGLWQGDLEAKVSPSPKLPADAPPVEQHDLLFVKGLGAMCRPGFSVHNSEFISFHPYQCLPRYEIVYEI